MMLLDALASTTTLSHTLQLLRHACSQRNECLLFSSHMCRMSADRVLDRSRQLSHSCYKAQENASQAMLPAILLNSEATAI